jgi:hypothetical protein
MCVINFLSDFVGYPVRIYDDNDLKRQTKGLEHHHQKEFNFTLLKCYLFKTNLELINDFQSNEAIKLSD